MQDPLIKRLALDKHMLDELCSSSDLISSDPLDGSDLLPPSKYRITYDVKSIVGVNDDQSPIYSESHIAEISLPSGYPMVSAPSCYMKTPIWHPNIRSGGNLAGHICINAQVLGTWHTLDLLVEQIGEMLQYKNYHALKMQPYPEDPIVAKWVLEYAEPQGIIDKSKGIAVDSRPLRKPSQEWLDTRKEKSKISIRSIRVKSAISRPAPSTNEGGSIKIVKR